MITDEFTLPEVEEMDGTALFNDIKSSPNNFSYWFPKVESCGIPVPSSFIIPVPIEVFRSEALERDGDAQRIRSFIEESVMPVIPADWKRVFVKNGCFSNKFMFGSCVTDADADHIAESFMRINYDSFCYDTGGNTEFIVRRLIDASPEETAHSIYGGMPLRNEMRVFFDFDRGRSLYAVNYWDWEYCHEGIGRCDEDGKRYAEAYPGLDSFFREHYREVMGLADRHLGKVGDLHGVWSVDFMYADGRWWLIDMAVGHRSAYFDFDRCAALQDHLDNDAGREWTRFADRRPEPNATVLVRREGMLSFCADGFGIVDGKESWSLMRGNSVRSLEIRPEDGWSLVPN